MIAKYLSLIAFSHTVFAMPFALLMLLVVARDYSVSILQFLLILTCLVAARSCAMAFNRIVDARIDHKNPRTAKREIPAGQILPCHAKIYFLFWVGIFLTASFGLGLHCAVLAPGVLLVLCGYSYFKRFSCSSHLVLGFALSLAPGGVWYAFTANFNMLPVWLMLAVLFWVAGFDILYSLQDIEFDRTNGLCSVPARFGEVGSKYFSLLLHLIAVGTLFLFGQQAHLGTFYFAGLLMFSILLLAQHLRIYWYGLAVIDQSFFIFNGSASIALLVIASFDSSLWT